MHGQAGKKAAATDAKSEPKFLIAYELMKVSQSACIQNPKQRKKYTQLLS